MPAPPLGVDGGSSGGRVDTGRVGRTPHAGATTQQRRHGRVVAVELHGRAARDGVARGSSTAPAAVDRDASAEEEQPVTPRASHRASRAERCREIVFAANEARR